MASLQIKNTELILIQAIESSKFKTGFGDYVWLSSCLPKFGKNKRLLDKAVSQAIENGLIIIDDTDEEGGDDLGVKLSPFASRILTAINK